MATVESTKPQQAFHSALFEHLASYSLVGYAYKTAQTYYSRVKTSNRYLEYGLGTAEYITAAATKTAEPLLSKVDEFGLTQLVKVEEKLSVPLQKLTQLPVDLLEKTLAFGEDSLDYWLPLEESEPAQSEQKKKAQEELTLSHLSSRAYNLAETLQTRARDKVVKSPYVATPVELVRTKAKQAKELKDRVVQLPSAVSQYVTQRKNAVVAAVSGYYSHINQTFTTLTDHLFDFLYYVHHQYDTLKSTSPKDFGIFLANTIHRLSEYLYEHVYPTRYVKSLRSLYQRFQAFVANNVARFSKKDKKTPTENGHHHEEGQAEKTSD